MPTVSELMAANISNAQTNVQAWGDIIINVKSYGAKGDGISDDTVAIQKAINAANKVGKHEIEFPAGTYKYTTLTNTAGIVFVGDGVTLIGSTPMPLTSLAALSADVAQRAINIMSAPFNAKGDGVTDDTAAIRAAIREAIDSKNQVFIPAGTFLVTSNILSVERDNASRVSGLSIMGVGNIGSVLKFVPTSNDAVLFDLTNVWHSIFQDFKVEGVGEKGIGMRLGDPTIRTVDSATYNCDFTNLYFRNLDFGIRTYYGWGNSFINLKTRYCNKGMVAYGGSNSFTAYNAEACYEYGIKIIGELVGNGSDTTVSFNGFIIESNPIGMIIDSGNVVINNGYFESNPTANIQAGVNGTSVASIVINGMHNGSYGKFIFNDVNTLSINGVSGYTVYNQFRISNKVKSLSISESSQMVTYPLATYIQTINSTMKKATPIISNDLQNINAFASPLPLDFSGAVQMRPALTTGSLVTFNGKKAIKYVATSGTFNGMYMFLDFTNRYLKLYKKIKVKTRLYIDTTTFSSISNSRMYSKVQINYLDNMSAAKSKAFYEPNPDDPTNTTYNIRDNHISHVVRLDLDEMIATIPDYGSLQNIYIYYYPIVTAAGGETFYFEGVEIYPNTEVKDVLLDSVNVNPFNLPVIISPNGTRYQLTVTDAGVLTASAIT
ncbi:glycosyl hydrolase family 28-related protein [Paenibacillus contaminans]|uniref:Rhamnogalacturonase A/B/Epimerase-like pectate lyase domain-containing protein n=1 Tax=Paenibacillus contaminans TaxID=450362 RepID=A0A329MQZ0_9BACL|nr:glycosyl hydrolase family 28-related protein [Paenibacillus contaminans]RAV22204.1 hypothetical protein DQG23_04430 [Paenibacillus contaminans]